MGVSTQKTRRASYNTHNPLDIMAKKLQLSDPQVVALMGQHKRLIPWRSAAYNDEMTLLQLRTAHPNTEWSLIRDMFNEAVPCKRNRSIDSIKNKWRVLRTRSRNASQASRNPSQAAPATQTVSEDFVEDVSDHYFYSNTVLTLLQSTATQVVSAMQINIQGYLESQYDIVTEEKVYRVSTQIRIIF